MINCPNCNRELEEGVKFCDGCGTEIVETVFCHNCGKKTKASVAFCQNCGTALSDDIIAAPVEKKKFTLPKFTLPKFKLNISKKKMTVICSCVAVVLVIAIVLTVIFTGMRKNNFALYLKDGEMYYTGISKIDPMKVTRGLFDDADYSDSDIVSVASVLGTG